MEPNHRVRDLRLALSLTMREFGDALGISSGAVSNIETGYRNVTDKHIKLICAAFPSVSEHWLRTGEGGMFVEASTDIIDDMCEQYGLDGIAKAMLRAYTSLDADSRAAISRYIHAAVNAYLADAQAQADEAETSATDIDAEVEQYRQQLIAERAAKAKSSASPDITVKDA